MADGSTSNYSLILPEVDGAEGTWGTSINTNLTNLDSLLSGSTALTAIVVDNVKIDGSNIGLVGDPDLITLASNSVTVAGTLNATALTGPLTGDVTGNVTGNITGNVTGNITATSVTVDGTVTADNFTLTRTTESTVASLEMFTDSNNDTFISERDADNGSLKILGTTLQLRADDLTLRNRAGNDLYLKGHINGATNLYYDYSTYNTPKLATTATGVTVTGTVTADGISVGDDQSIYVGAGNDLQIIHQGAAQRTDILETGGGNLRIAGRAIEINNDTGTNEYQIVLDGTGATNRTKLFSGQPSNSTDYKLSTNPTGIDVKGTVTADGLTLGDSEYIKIGVGNGSGTPDLQIFSGGTNAFIEQPSGSGTTNLIIRGQNINLRNDADATLLSTDNDQVRMWTQVAGSEDSTNAAAKFATTATGIDVNGIVNADGLTVDTSNTEATVTVGTNYFNVIGTDATSGLKLSNTNNTTAGQSDILFQRTENPVVNGTNTGIGQMLFEADNSGGSPFLFAGITAYANQFTAGAEEAFFAFTVEDGTGSRNEKLRINKNGIDVTGIVNADGLALGDDETITLGDSNELTITHKGSNGNSTIKETGSGNLILQADDLTLEDTNGNKFIKGVEGGTVQIWHNSAAHATAKLATKATGIDVNGTVTADSFIIEDGSGNKTTLAENAGGNITLTLPSATGTLALTSDIGFVAPTTVVGSAAIDDMTSNISKKYVHTGGAVTLKFPNVTASSNLGNTWVVVNAGTDTLTFDRVSASQFKKLNGSTVASLANTVTLSKGGVAELTVTADNQIIIFGSGVI